MTKIQVLGPGCTKCNVLYSHVEQAARELFGGLGGGGAAEALEQRERQRGARRALQHHAA